jgi:hypothetical protein
VEIKKQFDKFAADYKVKRQVEEKKLIDKHNKEKADLKQKMEKEKKSAAEIQKKQKELIAKQKIELNTFHIDMSKKQSVAVTNFISTNTTNNVVNAVSNTYITQSLNATKINAGHGHHRGHGHKGSSKKKDDDAPKNATPVPDSWLGWLRNIFNALFGIEGFADMTGNFWTDYFVFAVLFGLLAIFVFGLLTAYSAARVSYCYNKFLGNSDSESFLWSILCFFFPQWYWTFYPFLFNPLCDIKKNRGVNNSAMSGGKSRSNKKNKNVRRTR